MGLGSRTARHHETMRVEAVDNSTLWDFQPHQAVMTVDGFRGVVVAVLDGPISGTESYEVALDNGLGGGEYTASQLKPLSDVHGNRHSTAAEDYPELGSVLEDRPDIARNTVLASKTAGRREEVAVELSATAAEVDDALDVPGLTDFMAANETGPTKYSSLHQAINDAEMSQYSNEIAKGHEGTDDDDDEDHDDNLDDYPEQHDYRHAASHQTVDGTQCQEGTAADVDENGHLTWNGHAAQGDSGGYHTADDMPYSTQAYASAFHRGAALMREASKDPDFRFHVTASWADVRRKAKRIRTEGGVHVTLSTEGLLVAEVKGDTNVYETGLQRLPGKSSIQTWSCGCKWGAYHWGAEDDFSRFAGRMCSHALALHYEAQSRGMFGRSIDPDHSSPHWVPRRVVVKYDIGEKSNVSAPATSMPGDYARIASLSPITILLIASAREHTLAATAVAMQTLGFTEQYVPQPLLSHLAAVNNAWGEPTPNPEQAMPGPTMPPDKQANPADTGWASAADPTSWDQAVPDNQVDRMTASKDPVAGLTYTDCEACGNTVRSRDKGGVYSVCNSCGEALPDVSNRNEFGPGKEGARSDQPGYDPKYDDYQPHQERDDNFSSDTGAESDLHDEPEPALPATDGASDAAQDPFGDVGATGDPSDLSPEDPSFVSTGSLEEATDAADIVAAFQATAGAQQLQGGGGSSQADNAEIAQMAMATLQTTALKDFTPGEQAAIINEGKGGERAANFDKLNITGTHYEPLEAALAQLDAEEDDGGWLS